MGGHPLLLLLLQLMVLGRFTHCMTGSYSNVKVRRGAWLSWLTSADKESSCTWDNNTGTSFFRIAPGNTIWISVGWGRFTVHYLICPLTEGGFQYSHIWVVFWLSTVYSTLSDLSLTEGGFQYSHIWVVFWLWEVYSTLSDLSGDWGRFPVQSQLGVGWGRFTVHYLICLLAEGGCSIG